MEKQNSNNNIAMGIIWKFMERVFSQGVSFIVSVILARLLLPDDYGAVAIVLVFIEIANVFIASGLNASLIQKKEINETEKSTIFYCCIILGVFLYGVMFFAAPFIAVFYKMPILTPIIRVFALRLPIASIQQVPAALISRELDFKKFFLSTTVGTICSAIVGIAMALAGFGVWALVAQSLISALTDAIILSIVAKWRPKKIFSLKAATPLISYGSKIMAADVIGTLLNNLSSIIIGYRYSSAQLAYYTKGKNLPYMFRSNIYMTILSVLFPAMSKFDSIEEIKSFARRSVKMLAYIIFPIMMGMICISEDLVIALYTEKWISMTPFINIVCIECMISIIPMVGLQTLKASGHSGIILKMETLKKVIFLVLIFIAMNFGVKAIAWSLPINVMIEVLLNYIFSVKITGYRMREQIKDILVPLLLSFGMGVAIFAVSLIKMNIIVGLALKVFAGIVVYLALSIIFKVEEFKTILGFVKSKLHV